MRHTSGNHYEGRPEARRKCIARYGPSCFVYSFDFATADGEAERASGYIGVPLNTGGRL